MGGELAQASYFPAHKRKQKMALAPPPWGLPHHTTPLGYGWPGVGATGGDWDPRPDAAGPWASDALPIAPATPSAALPAPDPLDLCIGFLKRRDGIDKLLKLVRYTAKLALVTVTASQPAAAPALALAGGGSAWPTSPAHPPHVLPAIFTPARLAALEASIGDARKAYRLGKWLQGVAAFREAGGWEALGGGRGVSPLLAACAALGDGLYFFLEQGTWLVRAGVAPLLWGPAITRASATAELASYAASSALALVSLDALALREVALRRALASRGAWPGNGPDVSSIRADLAVLAAKRTALRLALLQDGCDALLAASDLRRGSSGLLASKPLLALAGLTSAILGTRKVWLATVQTGQAKAKAT